MITYINSAIGINPNQLTGFFVGWPNKPNVETHLKLLQHSDYVILALDDSKVVGFITAISDNVLSVYIPLLEVLPNYQHKGIGSRLVKKMLEQLKDFYMIDLSCDENLQEFYKQFGMYATTGMKIRNYPKQSGKVI